MGATPLATKSSDADKKISYLIEKGADIDRAAMIAIDSGDLDSIELLVTKGANIDFNRGLWDAAEEGHVEVAEYMLKNRASNIEIKVLREALIPVKYKINSIDSLKDVFPFPFPFPSLKLKRYRKLETILEKEINKLRTLELNTP